MIAVVCVDDRGGMLFNRRRQSQDRLLRQDLLREAGARPVWMNDYTRRQFSDPAENLRTADDFSAGPGQGNSPFLRMRTPPPGWKKRRACSFTAGTAAIPPVCTSPCR